MFAHPTDQLRHPGGTQIPRPKRPEDQRQRPARRPVTRWRARKRGFQMADKQMIEELAAEESMFVQTARSMSSDGTTLRLNEITASTLYFSDRPKRVVGHMSTVDFRELWGAGDNSFEDVPPNAVLAFLEPGDQA